MGKLISKKHISFAEDEGNCPAGFTGIGGGCYFHSLFKLNWFRAMEFCHSFGSHVSLACIETRELNRTDSFIIGAECISIFIKSIINPTMSEGCLIK